MISRGTFTEQINLKEENTLYPKEGGKQFPQFVCLRIPLSLTADMHAPRGTLPGCYCMISAAMPGAYGKQGHRPVRLQL